jgi:Uncharacterized protein conserved in bacteria
MKEKLTRNIGMKILSIILAALLWLAITNFEDPIIQQPFYNVPVQILNENEITKLNKVYDIKEGKTINFTVSARRSILEDISINDFNVTADFSKLSDVNAVKIEIACQKKDVSIISGSNEVMKVGLEDVKQKSFKVDVIEKGEPPVGYYVYQKTAATLLRISGPKSLVNSIAQVVAEVNVSEAQGAFYTTREKPKALDAKGNEIDSSQLQFSDTGVYVNIGMYKKKIINLDVTTKGNPADGFMVSKIEYAPKTIEIAAPDNILEQMDSLPIVEDVSGVSSNIEKDINLQEQLGKNVKLVGDNQSAVINIAIDKSETKSLNIFAKDIAVRNKPLGLKLNFLTAIPITLKVKAPFERLNVSVTKDIVNPYIDLKNYPMGTYSVKIGADLPEYMVLENSPTVSVHLTN